MKKYRPRLHKRESISLDPRVVIVNFFGTLVIHPEIILKTNPSVPVRIMGTKLFIKIRSGEIVEEFYEIGLVIDAMEPVSVIQILVVHGTGNR